MTSQYHMREYIQAGLGCLILTLKAVEDPILKIVDDVRRGRVERIILSGIGSSHTALVMAAPLFTWYSPVPVHLIDSWEFATLPTQFVYERTLLVAISRSGERDLVIDSLKRAERDGAYVAAVTGMPESLMTQYADVTVATCEGPEITYPKTKSVLSCAGALMRLALALAGPNDAPAEDRLRELRGIPAVLERTIAQLEHPLMKLVPTLERHEVMGVIGSGSNRGLALEAALKVQETSGVPTFGCSTCDFMGGLLGGVTGKWLVIAAVTSQDLELSQSVVQIARKLGARTLSIAEPDLGFDGKCDHSLTLPTRVDRLLAGLVYLSPMHLLTYYLTLAKGRNPDAPASMNIMLEALLPPGREEPELRKVR